jgi:hypothetical protein
MKTSKKTLGIVGVGVFVAIAVVGFGVYPVVNLVAQDAAALRDLKSQLADFEQDEKNVQEFTTVTHRFQEEFTMLDALFVNKETPIAFIEFIEEQAQKIGIDVKITPGQQRQAQGDVWPSLEFQVSTRTTYPEFFSFLQTLENAPYVLEVRSVHITGLQQEEQKQRTVDASLFIKVFTQEDEN